MKKNKIITGLLFSAFCSVVHAELGSINSESSGENELKEFAQKNKLPMPDGGIQIVSKSEMPSMQPNPVNATRKTLVQERDEENKLGYINTKSDDAIQLLAVKKNKFYSGTKKTFAQDNNPYDTHLKGSLAQIKLAYAFNGISFIDKKEIIGYAVAGTWDNGWTGVSETFTEPKIGVCDYVKNNLKITHGSAKLSQEYVTYDVNSKPTIIFAEGQQGDGFTYKVEWFDDTFYHVLKCASENFSKEAKELTVTLAKKIDSDPQ